MRYLIYLFTVLIPSVALADEDVQALVVDNGAGISVPEISVYAGMSALAVVGSVAALMWERRRKR